MNILWELEEYLDGVHHYDGYFMALCPFHSDSRPSFAVYPDYFICHSPSCGQRGSPEWLLSRLKTKNGIHIPVSPKKRLDSPFWALERQFDTLIDRLKYCHKRLQARDYLYKRGVTDELIKRIGIGQFGQWIIIPVRDLDNKVRGAVARHLDRDATPKYYVPRGQSPKLLYTWNTKQDYDNVDLVYLTFGIFSALPIYRAGEVVFSSLCGTHLHYSALQNIRKPITIIGDEREELAAYKLSLKLGWRGNAKRVDYPQDCYDLGDIYERYGDVKKWIT